MKFTLSKARLQSGKRYGYLTSILSFVKALKAQRHGGLQSGKRYGPLMSILSFFKALKAQGHGVTSADCLTSGGVFSSTAELYCNIFSVSPINVIDILRVELAVK